MKIWYDRKSKDPTYFVQMGIRNGKKTTTKNVARIGKHSELLKITDDPLAYAKEQVKKYNEEYKNKNCVSLEIKVDFAEKIKATGDTTSHSTLLNIGYFFLQQFYHDLKIDSFFESVTADRKNEFDPNLINRFLTYSRILYPDSKLGTHQNLCRFMSSRYSIMSIFYAQWISCRNTTMNISLTFLRPAASLLKEILRYAFMTVPTIILRLKRMMRIMSMQ